MQDVGAVHREGAGIRRGQGAEDLEQGRFARSGRAHDGDDLAAIHLKINALEHFQRAETLFNSLCLDNHDTKIRKNRRTLRGIRKKCAIFAVRNLE